MKNLSQIKVDLFEYCVLEEDIKLPASKAKISIPKLTLSTKNGKVFPNTTLLVNDSACKPKSSGPVVMSNVMTIKTFTDLGNSRNVDRVVVNRDPVQYEYYIRKGSKMVVCFMNKNVNDGYLTGQI